MKINELNDDCLLIIFRLLPIRDRLQLPRVCRQWSQLIKKFDLHAEQSCLAMSKRYHCNVESHQPHNEDLINFLFKKRLALSSNQMLVRQWPKHATYYIKFDIFNHLLNSTLNLQILILNCCVNIDKFLLKSIVDYCQNLKHLAFLDCTIIWDNFIWLSFSQQIGSRLTCLELINCVGLSEHAIATLLRFCISLVSFALSSNDLPLQGLCLELLPKTIQHLVLQNIEHFHADGMTALLAIVSGHARNLLSLELKSSRIALKILRLICRQFRLQRLRLGDYFDTLAIRSPKEIGRQISQLKTIECLQLSLPEMLPFDHSLNEIIDAFISNRPGQSQLKRLELIGASISSSTFKRVCNMFPHIEKFALTYLNQFSGLFRPTNEAFCSLVQLTKLRHLTLNNCELKKETICYILKTCDCLQFINFQKNPDIGPYSFRCLIDFAKRVTHSVHALLTDTGLNVWDVYPLEINKYDDQLYVRPLDNLKIVINCQDLYTDSSEEEEIEREEEEEEDQIVRD